MEREKERERCFNGDRIAEERARKIIATIERERERERENKEIIVGYVFSCYRRSYRPLDIDQTVLIRNAWIEEYDLYELLGVESSSEQPRIKAAYRALQKQCHPDVAGSAGHDMAVILNDIYALLSDPVSRSAYDQLQADNQTLSLCLRRVVERSNLAALEFLMSKQQRGSVRLSAGNTVGARASDIFSDVNKFQRRFREIKEKASRKESKESDLLRKSRISAVQGIRSISNWWYWTPFKSATVDTETSLIPIPSTRRIDTSATERLKEAAAAKRKAEAIRRASISYRNNDDYWTPMLALPSQSGNFNMPKSSTGSEKSDLLEDSDANRGTTRVEKEKWGVDLKAPLLMAMVSAAAVGYKGGDAAESVGLKEHIGGDVVLRVVNSFELQVLLAGVTWFVIGLIVVGLVTVVRKGENA
ncbi:Chaperone protein DnaJ [Ananas comosus]|uniref:Chaperone protein DnaJ n=1 Tax=Ananas comosus TaxID=4615 RepID=A0A199VJ90_ANACO|nr:Chaperone protein DnaJ [Ananas comosus]